MFKEASFKCSNTVKSTFYYQMSTKIKKAESKKLTEVVIDQHLLL